MRENNNILMRKGLGINIQHIYWYSLNNIYFIIQLKFIRMMILVGGFNNKNLEINCLR